MRLEAALLTQADLAHAALNRCAPGTVQGVVLSVDLHLLFLLTPVSTLRNPPFETFAAIFDKM